jgi:Na+/H+ antiporter NhaD/arsenite permease-like protein
MVIFVVVPQRQVYIILGEQGNLQTLCLLIGMMLLSYYYDREGVLRFVSRFIFGKGKPFKHVLWRVCVLSAVLSAIITNDATCVVLTPLILTEHKQQDRSKKEYAPLLLGIATSANIGSAATFFGNPQNAFIAANSDVSLLIFFMTTLPAALIGTAISIFILYLCYFKTIWHKKPVYIEEPDSEPEVTTNLPEAERHSVTEEHSSFSESLRKLAQSRDQSTDPFESSQIVESYSELHTHMQDDVDSSGTYGTTPSVSTQTTGKMNRFSAPVLTTTLEDSAPARPRFHWSVWRKGVFVTWLMVVTVIIILLLAIPPLPEVEFNLGLVPVGAAVLTMLVDTIVNRKYAFDAMKSVDWTLILMFMGLFIWLAGFQNTLFPDAAFEFMLRYMDLSTVQEVLVFTVFVAVGSNVLSNVPLVILIVQQLSKFQCGDDTCTSQLTGVVLAWVSTIAGNFTLIGSIANIIVAEQARNVTASKDANGKARKDGYRLSFWVYLKFGFCSTMLVLFVGLPIVYFVGDNVNIKI